MNGIMRRPGLLWLLLGAGCCGCLESKLVPVPDPAFSAAQELPEFEPASEQTLTPLISQEPAPVSQSTLKPVQEEQPRGGFTGALVFVKSDCPPCHNLVTDLQFLAENHGWTIADAALIERPAESRTDWIISAGPGAPVYPLIEFYKDGSLVGESRGYSLAVDFADRREPLLNLIRSHPRYTASRK